MRFEKSRGNLSQSPFGVIMMRYRSHNCAVTAEFNKLQFILRRVYLTILQALQRGLRPRMWRGTRTACL